MRRGRPALRATFRSRISDFLKGCPYPVTTRTIQHNLLNTGKSGSWHTVKKYLDELARDGIIISQPLPSDGRHKPLIVYFMRSCKPQPIEDFCKDF